MIEYQREEQIELMQEKDFLVKVIGVGGAGSNVLDQIAIDGMDDAELICMNTDIRTLKTSTAHARVQIGKQLTRGLGAGGDPELGILASEEAEEEIRAAVRGQNMVFICTGLGGGTGSGAAPTVSRIAKEEGAFVVVFATMPFSFEGRRRIQQAETALKLLERSADALITFENDRMGELVLPKEGIQQAFENADKIICQSVRAITNVVTQPGLIQIGMDDLLTALNTPISRCLFGYGEATGKNRAQEALKIALRSPLLDRGKLLGKSRNALVHIVGGPSMTLFEVELLMNEMSKNVGSETQILFGSATDDKMDDRLSVTIISSLSLDELRHHESSAGQAETRETPAGYVTSRSRGVLDEGSADDVDAEQEDVEAREREEAEAREREEAEAREREEAEAREHEEAEAREREEAEAREREEAEAREREEAEAREREEAEAREREEAEAREHEEAEAREYEETEAREREEAEAREREEAEAREREEAEAREREEAEAREREEAEAREREEAEAREREEAEAREREEAEAREREEAEAREREEAEARASQEMEADGDTEEPADEGERARIEAFRRRREELRRQSGRATAPTAAPAGHRPTAEDLMEQRRQAQEELRRKREELERLLKLENEAKRKRPAEAASDNAPATQEASPKRISLESQPEETDDEVSAVGTRGTQPQTATARGGKKSASAQAELQLDPVRGRFEKASPTMVDGENLDVPTFFRKRGKKVK